VFLSALVIAIFHDLERKEKAVAKIADYEIVVGD
jgi:hypothetical protein